MINQTEIKRFEEIDYLRAIAIILVILSHLQLTFLNEYISAQFASGWTGVDLFYAISGFVVTNSFLSRRRHYLNSISTLKERLRFSFKFMIVRAIRIMPIAWVWIFVPVILSVYFNESGHMGNPPWVINEAKAALLFYYNYYSAITNHGVIGHFWSLSVEEHFYFGLSLLLCILSSRKRIIIFFVTLLTFIAFNRYLQFNYNASVPRHFLYMTHYRIDGIILGAITALVYQENELILTKYTKKISPIVFKIISVLLILYLAITPGIFEISNVISWGYLTYAISSTLLVIFAISGEKILSFGKWSNLLLKYIGQRSYSLYLTHFPLILIIMELRFKIFQERFIWPNYLLGWFALVVYLFFLAIITELTYQLMEKPLIYWAKRLW